MPCEISGSRAWRPSGQPRPLARWQPGGSQQRLSRGAGHYRYPIFDGYHEAWPAPEYCEQIAHSFSEFLEKALRGKGRLFYLQQSQDPSR